MILKNRKAFTLIELIIVITIIAILTLIVLVPYDFYSNIGKVRISGEVIDQAKSEAMLNSNSIIDKATKKNQNIGIFFNRGSKEFSMMTFPFDYTGAITEASGTLLRTIKLEDGVNINKIRIDSDQDTSSVVYYFKAPDGNLSIYKNGFETGSDSTITIGYRNSVTGVLSKTINIKQ